MVHRALRRSMPRNGGKAASNKHRATERSIHRRVIAIVMVLILPFLFLLREHAG